MESRFCSFLVVSHAAVTSRRCCDSRKQPGGHDGESSAQVCTGAWLSPKMSSHHHLNSSSGEINHIHFVSEDIGSLYVSEEYADVTIVVAGQKFRSHKLILAARSEYFRALLFGGMKESMQSEIELNTASLPAFKGLLKYIYTGRMSLTNERDEVPISEIILSQKIYMGLSIFFLSFSDFCSVTGHSRYSRVSAFVWVYGLGSSCI